MRIDETINETIKAEILKKLGNPTYFYQAWMNNDGWYLEETKIDKIDLEKRFSSGYEIRINGNYVCETFFLFDKEAAKEYVRQENINFFKNKIKKNKEYLETIDSEVIRKKAEARAEIEIAENKLLELEGNKQRTEHESQ